MDTNRYYFPNVIEDEALSILAVQAKELMQQNDEILKMFRMNNEILSSIHPGDVLTFMKEINKSMFSSDSSIEDGINLAQSYKRPSSPKRLDPDDEAEKEKLRSATLKFITPIRRQKIKAQPVNPTMEKTGTSDEQSLVGTPSKLESPRSAQITKMASRLTMDEKECESPQKITGIIEAIGQKSPRSAQIAKVTANLAMVEKDFDSPKKVVGSVEARSQSPRSAQTAKMTADLTVEEKEFETPKKVVGSVKAIKQKTPHSAQIEKVTASLIMEGKEFESTKKAVGSIEESSRKSPRSSQIPKMTTNLTKEEKEFDSPAKMVGSIHASSQESPLPSVILQTAPNFDMSVKESRSPAKDACTIKLRNQETPRSSVITRMASSPAKVTGASKRKNEESPQCDEKPTISDLPIHDKESASHVIGDETATSSDTHRDSPNPEEKAEKSDNTDLHNKHHHVEGMKISKPAIIETETPSPIKKSKISSIPTFVTQQYASPTKEGKIAENLSVRHIVDAKLNISPIETLKGIAREDRKRKSLSPTRRSKATFKSGTQESPRSAELTRMTSSLAMDEKESRNIIQDDQQVGISATNKDSPNPEEDASKSENPDSSNKCIISHAEGMETSEPVLIASEIPSPVKKSKLCSIPTVDIQDFSSPAEKVRMAEKSPEDTEVTPSRTPSDKLDTFFNEKVEQLARDDRKRQSLSPKKRKKTLFESIPKVIKLAGEEEIDIEVVDLEYDASPTTPRSKSADYRSDSTKDSSIKIPVQDASKPKALEPSSETDQSGKSEASSEAIKTKNLSLTEAIQEFNIVLDKRDKRVKKLFIIFLSFQSSINFIKAYVFNVSSIFLQLDISGKYTDEEFKGIVFNANVVTIKLINKIKSWKKDVDLDADTWRKCFQQIEQLKAKYEPLLTNEGEPAVTFEVVQRYEREARAIWKKMGDMIIQGDSKRAAFSYIAPDIERLVKMLVKCLILVGILLPR